MSSANIAVLAVLWAVVIWRLPALRQSTWKRSPWITFFGLAVALTADQPPVITATDQLSGITDLAVLIKHLAVVAACAAVLHWVIAVTDPSSRRRYPGAQHAVTGLVIITLAALFTIMPRHETTRFTETETGWTAAVYLWVFYCYLGTALGVAGALFWRARRGSEPSPARPGLRPGLLLLAVGSSAVVVYAAWQAVLLAFRMAHPLPPAAAAELLSVAQALEDLSIALTLAGTVLLPAAVAWQSLRSLRALAVLRPLWLDLTIATPQVAAGPLVAGGKLTRTLRHTHVRLIRRVAEIRDSALQLSTRIPETAVTDARRTLGERGWTGTSLSAATEACWLRLAARAAAEGTGPAPGAAHVLPGGTDLAEETAWLCEVAKAYRSPAVQQVADLVSEHAASSSVIPAQRAPGSPGITAAR